MTFQQKNVELQQRVISEIERVKEGQSKKSITQLQTILKELQSSSKKTNMVLCYPRFITDSWDYSDSLGIEKLKDGFRTGKGSDSPESYYQVTSKSNAQTKNFGTWYLDTVIGFEVNAAFSRDASIGDSSLWDIARISDRLGLITISKVVETGFKESKVWW